MTTVVVDASVVVKWALPDRAGEPDVPAALRLLTAIRRGDVHAAQPPHWLAEAAAVLARLAPKQAVQRTALLDALHLEVRAVSSVYQRAVGLAVDLDHHLFDTLYHAVALETPGAVLVTADARYARKAEGLGALVRLADFTPA